MPPSRSALRANGTKGARVRKAIAELKRELAAGRVSLAEALDDPRAAPMQVLDLFLAAPRMGRRTAPRLLARFDVRSNLLIRELTDGQHERLLRGLSDPQFVASRVW